MKEKPRPEKKEGFQCAHCQTWVSLTAPGTEHRNHCPSCLWSRHVDIRLGDRKSTCQGSMMPIGFTFKKEGIEKYAKKPKKGELMVIHQCVKCRKIFINRLAGDDDPQAVARIFKESLNMPEDLQEELEQGIEALTERDEKELMKQLGLE